MDDLTAVMCSCEVRTDARATTLPQLARVGITPTVFLSPCNPAGPEQNRAVAIRAFTHALPLGLPVLFIEDDVDVAEDFAWHVRTAMRLNALTYLYLNDTYSRLRAHHGRAMANRIVNRQPLVRGAYAVQQRAALFGTQCVIVPHRLVSVILDRLTAEEAARQNQPTDGVLHLWTRHVPTEPVYVMLPHPVQHRQDRTGRKPTVHTMRSLSFGLPWADHDGDGVVEPHNATDADRESTRANYERLLADIARKNERMRERRERLRGGKTQGVT